MTTSKNEQTPVISPAWSALLDGHAPAAGWLGDLQLSGRAAFARLGFPSRKNEAFQYTPLSDLNRGDWALAPWSTAHADDAPAAPAATLPGDGLLPPALRLDEAACELVFVDGRFSPDHSRLGTFEGVTVSPLDGALDTVDGGALLLGRVGTAAAVDVTPLSALNAALFTGGALIDVAPGTQSTGPIHLVFVHGDAAQAEGTARVSAPRVLTRVGRGASVSVLERHVGLGTGAHLCTAVTEVLLDDGARADWHIWQDTHEKATLAHLLAGRLGRDAHFKATSLGLGSGRARFDARLSIDAEGATVDLGGLNLLSGSAHHDDHLWVDHRAPHCQSNQLFKGIYGQKSHGVFDGMVVVHQAAQKTDAVQRNASLLVSDDAQVDTRPELEIYADDVKCAHGSTVGQLDPEQLFYLQARGIPAVQAQELLTRAFAEEVMDRYAGHRLQPEARRLVDAQLTRLAFEIVHGHADGAGEA